MYHADRGVATAQTARRVTDAAEDTAPIDWREHARVSEYRHVTDRTAQCPVMTREQDRITERISAQTQKLGLRRPASGPN